MPHLFSLSAAFTQVSSFVGNLAGGLLPLLWAMVLSVPALEPSVARWALATGLPLTLLALMPLAFMRERPVKLVENLTDLLTLERWLVRLHPYIVPPIMPLPWR